MSANSTRNWGKMCNWWRVQVGRRRCGNVAPESRATYRGCISRLMMAGRVGRSEMRSRRSLGQRSPMWSPIFRRLVCDRVFTVVIRRDNGRGKFVRFYGGIVGGNEVELNDRLLFACQGLLRWNRDVEGVLSEVALLGYYLSLLIRVVVAESWMISGEKCISIYINTMCNISREL